MRGSAAEILGRDAELERLRSFAASSDGPACLVLEGEPGIGKTTLWRVGVDEARASGRRVLTCSPVGGEARLSFAALTDLLNDVLGDVAAGLPAPQRSALEVALLFEEPGKESTEQRTVAAATLSALVEIAHASRVLVAIDDAHWLDQPSEAALAFAVRRLGDAPVSVLLSRRVGGGAARSALELALEHRHGRRLARLSIGPLSAATLHDLIQERLGVAFPRGILDRIARTSGGNPFFALELAAALLRLDELPEPGGRLPVPETLHELVRGRLDEVSIPAQDALAAAAALSEPTLASLEASGATEAAIDEAVGAGVIEIQGGARVRFTHPLLAFAAYDRLGLRARRSLHRELANLVGGEERARHLALGAGAPSSGVATALHEAAREAAARGAIGAAAELAEHSVRLTPTGEGDERVRRRIEAAGYEMRNGDAGRARGNLEPLLAELVPGPTRARVLVGLARLAEESPERGLELCLQSIQGAGVDDPALAAEAHQLAAEMSMLSGDVPNGLEHARIASELAERAGDAAILIESLGTLCHYQTYTGAITPGLLEHAVEFEGRQRRPSNNYSPREILGLRLMYADRIDEARELLEASYATATELGDELDRSSVLIHLTQLECRAGRLGKAAEHGREVEVLVDQAGTPRHGGRFASALAAAHLGRIDEARAAGEEGSAIAAAGGGRLFHTLNEWALGFLELSLGDAHGADRHLRPLPEALESMGYWNPGVRPVYADAIEARIGVGDLEVDALIDELERRGVALDNPWARAAAARCRGLLLAARGELEASTQELERALVEHEDSPQPLERGRTLLALGSVHRRAKHRAAAREALTQALDLFDNLGAPLWAERAAAELARIPGRGRAAGGLSETERRVAELVAEGLTNREVAARLFVTVRTVEANLSKVYAKLGVRSRTELAGRVGRQNHA